MRLPPCSLNDSRLNLTMTANPLYLQSMGWPKFELKDWQVS